MSSNGSPKIIAVTSGKGGVGKTNISLNLGIALSMLNKRICIFDADLGLANINILLGIHPEFDIQHVISGEKNIRDIIVKSTGGIQIIPGSSGIQHLADIDKNQAKRLILSFEPLIRELDFFIIDTSAGISSTVLSMVMAAHESILVVTKEPTSLTDGYALLKVITSLGHRKKINVIVNMVQSNRLAEKIFQKLLEASKKNLNIELNFLGSIITDQSLTDAVCSQEPVLMRYPESPSSKTFTALAKSINKSPSTETEAKGTNITFWLRVLKILKTPLPTFNKKNTSAQPQPGKHIIVDKPDNKQRIESLDQQKKMPAKADDNNGKNVLSKIAIRISDIIANNRLSTEDFCGFNEIDKSYIDKLDQFLDKYSEFLELSFIGGKGKYFIEVDFDNLITEETKQQKFRINYLTNPFINSTTDVMKKMANMDIIPQKNLQQETMSSGDAFGIVKLSGCANILVSIGFPKECILYIFSSSFGENITFLNADGSINSNIIDWVGEITSVIVGEARRELSDKGYNFKATIPEVIARQNYSIEAKVQESCFIIPFLTNKGIISLSTGYIK